MDELVWTMDQTFEDPSGNSIRVLQRSLPKNIKQAKHDLIPFFHEPTFFQLDIGAQKEPIRLIGILDDITMKSQEIQISIQTPDKRSHQWYIEPLSDVQLTVWRINAVLDTLQVNIFGKGKEFYMQTGGNLIKQILQTYMAQPTVNKSIADAEKIFARNAIGKRRYSLTSNKKK